MRAATLPESVKDRPTSAHEHIFLLAKSAKYYYDSDAIREPHLALGRQPGNKSRMYLDRDPQHHTGEKRRPGGDQSFHPAGRNLRDVWLLGPKPFPEAHFATFVPEIARRAILAGSSQRGCCPACGAPWERVVSRQPNPGGINGGEHREVSRDGALGRRNRNYGVERQMGNSQTLGWRPTCNCPGPDGDHPGSDGADYDEWPTKPALVLDPFCGAGTTLLAAEQLGRDSLGIELSPAYVILASRRLARAMGLRPNQEVPAGLDEPVQGRLL